MWQISRPPCERFELGQIFKWDICKNGLLPNGPKWVDSEKFISKLGLQTLGRFWQMGGCQIVATESQTPKGTQCTGG